MQDVAISQARTIERINTLERESKNHGERLEKLESKMDAILANVSLIKWLVVTMIAVVPAATAVIVLARTAGH